VGQYPWEKGGQVDKREKKGAIIAFQQQFVENKNIDIVECVSIVRIEETTTATITTHTFVAQYASKDQQLVLSEEEEGDIPQLQQPTTNNNNKEGSLKYVRQQHCHVLVRSVRFERW